MQIPSFSRFRRSLKRTRIFQPKYTKDTKYVRYCQGLKEYAEIDVHFSRQIIFVDEEIDIALLRGRRIPRIPAGWVKEATALERQVSDAVKEQENSRNPSLKSEELENMCEQIFGQLKHCPVEGKYNKPITFIAGMHEIENKKLPYSEVPQSEGVVEERHVEMKLASAETSVPTGYPETDVSITETVSFPDSYPASETELSSEQHIFTSESLWGGEIAEGSPSSKAHDAKIPEISYEGSSPPLTSEIQIEKRYESEITEEDDDPEYVVTRTSSLLGQEETGSQRRHEKMPISTSDHNGELASSSEAVLEPEMGFPTNENDLSEMGIQMSYSSQAEENKHHDESVAGPTQTDDFHIIHENESDLDMAISIPAIGKMSMYVEARLEFLSTSSSQETLNLKDSFGLVPERDNYFFSARKASPETFQVNGALFPGYLIVNRSGCSSNEMPTADEWRQAGVINLMEKNLLEKNFLLQNERPDCPDLSLLFLQRNNRLTCIPPSFFARMPALRFLDLSNTRIRALPNSLFMLTELQVLMLRSCVCLDSLPAEVKNLRKMEVLDLSSTDLYYLPKEIGQLTRLKHLHLSFYGPDYGSGYARLPSEMVSPNSISELRDLRALSIVVHPEDQRWIKIAGDVIQHVGRLKKLRYLQFYFPTIEALNYFVEVSPSWKEQRMRRFKFIVGRNFKRIISRVPDEVESKYEQLDQCLRFINGSEVPEVLKRVLKLVTAFYLDHHLEIQNLSEFGISNFKELKFCVVRECPNFQVMMVGEKTSGSDNETAFPNLEYFGMHYLWELERIWEDPVPSGSFKALRYLMVRTCHKLEYIASQSMLQSLSNLETLIVEDCESLKSISKENETVKYDAATLLPRLTELVLRDLPELLSLGSGLCPPMQIIRKDFCPKLILKDSGRTKRRKLLGPSCNCSSACI